MRAAIWAVVSSERQAAPDLVSIPEQVRLSREAIERRNWTEVREPVATVESRHVWDLASLLESNADLRELFAAVDRGEIDVIVTRDQSRLGRTIALQQEILSYFRARRVDVFFYTQAMEPGQRKKRLRSRDLVDTSREVVYAVGAAQAQEEVARLVARRDDGMTGNARAGRWRHSRAPYGYRRRVLRDDGGPGRRVLAPDLQIVEEEAAVLRELGRLYLDGLSFPSLEAHLRERYGIRMREKNIRDRLTSPVYVGVMIYGKDRVVLEADEAGRVRKRREAILTRERFVELAEAFLRTGEDARTEEEIADGVIVARGDWEPIFDPDTWLEIQHERRRRAEMHNIAASVKERYRDKPLSGLTRCGYCGGTLALMDTRYTIENPQEREAAGDYSVKRFYGCYNHRKGRLKGKCRPNRVEAEELFAAVIEQLREIASDPSLIARYVDGNASRAADEAQREIEATKRRIAAAEQAIRIWDETYEAGDLSREEWKEKTEHHRTALREARIELARLQSRTHSTTDDATRRERIVDLLERLEELRETNPGRLKAELRRIIRRIEVRDDEVLLVF